MLQLYIMKFVRWLFLSLSLFIATPSTVTAQIILPTIGEIQSDTAASPFVGKTVTFEGTVTGINEQSGSNGINYTLFMQDVVGAEDAYDDTSNGVAVYVGRTPPRHTPGDHIRVTGEVIEFYGLTEIGLNNQSIELLGRDNRLPDPVPFALEHNPAEWDAYSEAREGMLVSIDEPTTVCKTSSDPCEIIICMDDSQSTIPVMHSSNLNCDAFPILSEGTIISGVEGILHYSFDQYRIIQTTPFSFTETAVPRQIATSPIRITEIMYRPPYNDEQLEWVELTNISDRPFDLTEFRIGDRMDEDGREGMHIFPTGSVIEGGRSIVIAQTSTAFQQQYSFKPNYEFQESDPAVPNVRPDANTPMGGFALANDGDELILVSPDGTLIDGISYGENATLFSPAVQQVGIGESLARIPADCDTDTAADFKPNRAPDPGRATFDGTCTGDVALKIDGDANLNIGTIQGAADVSPYINQIVTFDGIVTGIHEDRNSAGTIFYSLYVQDLPTMADNDPETSDGLSVFFGRTFPNATLGDHIRVTGQIIEFFGLTEIAHDNLNVEIIANNQPLPNPILIDPPIDFDEQLAYYEAMEGMRVTTGDDPISVMGATFSTCGLALALPNLPEMTRPYRRDKTDGTPTILPVIYESDIDCTGFPIVKVGDTVQGMSGVLTYNFDQFKLLQQGADVVVEQSPFPPLPNVHRPTDTQFSLISYNVENFFDGIDDTGRDFEPKLSGDEIAVKQTKIAHAIGDLLHCPTIVAIQEVEKAALLDSLAAELADFCPFTYEVAHLESADARGIDVAYLFDPTRITVEAVRLERACTAIETGIEDEKLACSDGEQALFSRPPIYAQITLDSDTIHLFNNHFKSKLGGEDATEPRRIAQATHLNHLVATLFNDDPDANVIVLGDFNDFEQSAPLRTLAESGLVNVLQDVPDEQRYTYVYNGAAQMIDGIFVSESLQSRIHTVDIIHTNADYPDAFQTDLSAAHLPYKATDHDISYVIIGGERDATDDGEPTLWGYIFPFIGATIFGAAGYLLAKRRRDKQNESI